MFSLASSRIALCQDHDLSFGIREEVRLTEHHFTALTNIIDETMHGGITWADEQVREEL